MRACYWENPNRLHLPPSYAAPCLCIIIVSYSYAVVVCATEREIPDTCPVRLWVKLLQHKLQTV